VVFINVVSSRVGGVGDAMGLGSGGAVSDF
jgi:hypothetical protein